VFALLCHVSRRRHWKYNLHQHPSSITTTVISTPCYQVRKNAQENQPGSQIQIIVGVTADKFLENYKRKPVTKNHERCESVAGCKYVDEVISDAPLVTTAAFMDQHRIDYVFHGDDYSEEQKQKVFLFYVVLHSLLFYSLHFLRANQYYGDALARGAYFSVQYSSDAISTTALLRIAAARHVASTKKEKAVCTEETLLDDVGVALGRSSALSDSAFATFKSQVIGMLAEAESNRGPVK
jgi:hypothetical protein